jgi:hypothetical protein
MNLMPKENGVTDRLPASSFPVTPLPIALYVSDKLTFELYNGGQPARRFAIRWERHQGQRSEEGQAYSRSL